MAMMTRYEPFSNVLSLREAMDQLFRDSFVAPFGLLTQTTNSMPVDVYETGDAFVVEAFMPGLTPDNLTISVEQQTVTIHGEPRAEDLDGMRPWSRSVASAPLRGRLRCRSRSRRTGSRRSWRMTYSA